MADGRINIKNAFDYSDASKLIDDGAAQLSSVSEMISSSISSIDSVIGVEISSGLADGIDDYIQLSKKVSLNLINASDDIKQFMEYADTIASQLDQESPDYFSSYADMINTASVEIPSSGKFIDPTTYVYSNGLTLKYNKRTYNSWKKIKDMSSDTQYLIAINEDDTTFDVFKGKKGNWVPYVNVDKNGEIVKYSWLCGIGKDIPDNEHIEGVSDKKIKSAKYEYLTPCGEYKVLSNRFDYSHDEGDGSLKYCTRISAKKFVDISNDNGDFEKPANPDCERVYIYSNKRYNKGTGDISHPGNYYPGAKLSEGCIRSDEGSEFVYKNFDEGTTIYME